MASGLDQKFDERVGMLPWLGLGISTEFGARHGGLDINAFRASRPDLAEFLEIGIDLERGIDDDALAWAAAGHPTTYHFLDLNLEEPESLDAETLATVARVARSIGASWICGDAGLWHIGPRERGHGVLMPPVLTEESAADLARGVRIVREATGCEVLPENPPAHVFVGDLHLLDYFGAVAGGADCGLLLDVAHLAVYQRASGLPPLAALDRYPIDRVVEVHVAGGRLFEHGGKLFVDDDHGLDVLPDTWEILAWVLPRARNLRAIVIECERNPVDAVIPVFERVRDLAAAAGRLRT